MLLLLLPFVMAPKIAWGLGGLSGDVVRPDSVRAGRPFPVVVLVTNVSNAVQSDVVLRATLSVGSGGETYALVGKSAACHQAAGDVVACSLGDVSVGEKRVVRFTATSTETGALSVTLSRAAESG